MARDGELVCPAIATSQTTIACSDASDQPAVRQLTRCRRHRPIAPCDGGLDDDTAPPDSVEDVELTIPPGPSLFSSPSDTIKTRAQTAPKGQFTGPWNVATSTVRKEGFLALYKGTRLLAIRRFPDPRALLPFHPD